MIKNNKFKPNPISYKARKCCHALSKFFGKKEKEVEKKKEK